LRAVVTGRAAAGAYPAGVTGFVDTHSHMVPSGDDGVRSVDEGVELVLEAGRRGTAVQYATPHALERFPATADRRRRVMAAREQMRARLAGRVDFRIGWEIGPERWVLDTDPADLAMEGIDACLLELPLPHTGPRNLDMLIACAEHIDAAGLTPILAHPERCDLVVGDLGWVTRFRQRGWLTQVNGSSLHGRHGREAEDAGWTLIESGRADLVGSDGHRGNRPPYLNETFELVTARIGRDRAEPLFTGAALEPLGLGRRDARAEPA
jgi:protein-tyrosine phosphatase